MHDDFTHCTNRICLGITALVRLGRSSMAFNWRAYEAWRAHPMLNNNLRHALPGLGIGSAAFAVYVLYDKTIGSGSKGDHH